MTSYFVAVNVQSSMPNGIQRVLRYGHIDNPSPDGTQILDNCVNWLLDVTGLNDRLKHRVTTTFVCKNVPFEEPTKCRLYMTLTPGGSAANAIYLRQVTKDVRISPEYTMFDAFRDFSEQECIYDSPVSLGWSPLVLD